MTEQVKSAIVLLIVLSLLLIGYIFTCKVDHNKPVLIIHSKDSTVITLKDTTKQDIKQTIDSLNRK